MLNKSCSTPISNKKVPSKSKFTNGLTITKATPYKNDAAKAFNLILKVNSSSILFLVIANNSKAIRKNDIVIVLAICLSILSTFVTLRITNKMTINMIPNAIFLKIGGNKLKSF